jgi:hypothetical protein
MIDSSQESKSPSLLYLCFLLLLFFFLKTFFLFRQQMNRKSSVLYFISVVPCRAVRCRVDAMCVAQSLCQTHSTDISRLIRCTVFIFIFNSGLFVRSTSTYLLKHKSSNVFRKVSLSLSLLG